eukprot:TCONS_00034395-protein
MTPPNHHKGPIRIQYEAEPKRRGTAYAKRSATLKQKAHELNVITGAKVRLLINSNDSNDEKSYGMPVTAVMGTQTEFSSSIASVPQSIFGTPSAHPLLTRKDKETTPTATVVEEKCWFSQKVKNLPGIKRKRLDLEKEGQPESKRNTLKCLICNALPKSEKDKQLRKDHGVKARVLTCGFKDCGKRVHGVCAGIEVKAKVKLPYYLCPEHKSSSNELTLIFKEKVSLYTRLFYILDFFIYKTTKFFKF